MLERRQCGRGLLLAVGAAIVLGACGGTVASGAHSSTQARVSSASLGTVLRTVPPAFSNVNWSTVPFPGKHLVSPGMLPNAYCDMAPVRLWPSKGVAAYYLEGFGNEPLAVLPIECDAYNQSPISFVVYQSLLGHQPKLLEVLYEGNLAPRLLTSRVPTASVAAHNPHGWSGLFIWNGPGSRFGLNHKELSLAVSDHTLSLGGLAIPANGTLPSAGDSKKGYVFAKYTYIWTHGSFRFESSSAGASPVAPVR